MNVYFFVQFTDADLNQCCWLRFNERTPAGPLSCGAFEDALSAAEESHLVVFAPATEVNLAIVDLKAKNHKQMIAAVPYMLEEELSEDVEELHFALSTIDKKEARQLVGTISGAIMGKLYAAITKHGYISAAVVPQTLSIPYASDTWSLFIQENGATLRTGEYQGYGMDIVNLDEILSAERAVYRKQHDRDAEIVEYDFRADTKPEASQTGVDSAAGAQSEALALIGRYWLDHQGMLNLLQGSYRITTDMPGTLKLWATAASLTVVSLLLFVTNMAINNHQLSNHSQQLGEAMNAIYTEIFHDEPAGDAAAAMRKKLVSLQESRQGPVTPFLNFVAASGSIILQDRESRIARMSYNNKRMEIDIETTAFDRLEALQQKIGSDAIAVDLKAVTNNSGKINGRLVLAEVER